MGHIGWTSVAYAAAVFAAHIPIYHVVNKLYQYLGWPNQGPSSVLPALVGGVERALFVTAVLLKAPVFIPAWLALKVAGQWDVWKTGRDQRTRHVEGRDLFNVFLIGSGLSIGYSVLAAKLAEWAIAQEWSQFRAALGLGVVITLVLMGLGLFLTDLREHAPPAQAGG